MSPLGLAVSNRPLKVVLGATLNFEMVELQVLAYCLGEDLGAELVGLGSGLGLLEQIIKDLYAPVQPREQAPGLDV